MNRKDSRVSSDRRRKRAEDTGEKLADLGDTIGHIYAWNVMPLILLALVYFRDLDY